LRVDRGALSVEPRVLGAEYFFERRTHPAHDADARSTRAVSSFTVVATTLRSSRIALSRAMVGARCRDSICSAITVSRRYIVYAAAPMPIIATASSSDTPAMMPRSRLVVLRSPDIGAP
jgi:hypothetical protein